LDQRNGNSVINAELLTNFIGIQEIGVDALVPKKEDSTPFEKLNLSKNDGGITGTNNWKYGIKLWYFEDKRNRGTISGQKVTLSFKCSTS
jgi:hypothetical protein